MKKNFRELQKNATEKLNNAGIENADFEALQILLQTANFSLQDFYINSSIEADESFLSEYEKKITERTNGRPLQYILGEWDFYKSTFFVGEGVLIPRPETEQLVDMCVEAIKKNKYKTVYDLCAGSGCIGISIAKECPDVTVTMFELFDDALIYTRKNIEVSSLQNVSVRKFDVLNSNLSELPDVDVIVSNPPYIPCNEINSLQKEVLLEPITALDGGEDGLVFYRHFAEKWLDKLKANGFVAMECGEEQSDSICRMFSDKVNVQRIFDVFGTDRFVAGYKKLF